LDWGCRTYDENVRSTFHNYNSSKALRKYIISQGKTSQFQWGHLEDQIVD